MPRLKTANRETLRIGFLAPLSGPEGRWGSSGLAGCHIWSDWLNAHGGLMIAGRRHRVEITAFDTQSGPRATLAAAREMVEGHAVSLILTLGGDSFAPAMDYLNARGVLVGTLLPSDLCPDSPYLIAPAELHPLCNVTGVEWICRARPDIQRVAMCSQTDSLGLPSLAVYRTAFAAESREVVCEVLYPPEATDARAIVAEMLASDPDLLCWCSSAAPITRAMTKAAYDLGWRGPILACTADDYAQMIAETSAEFMSGYTFQFPDFDDPALADKAFFFNQPGAFFEAYNRRFPGEWSAVSWEYASILDLWHNAVQSAETTAPATVLAAMKRNPQMSHAFGTARWWGAELYGIDNALVGDWPVVGIRDGKARIVEFRSIPDWLARHGPALSKQLELLGQTWQQRRAARLAQSS